MTAETVGILFLPLCIIVKIYFICSIKLLPPGGTFFLLGDDSLFFSGGEG